MANVRIIVNAKADLARRGVFPLNQELERYEDLLVSTMEQIATVQGHTAEIIIARHGEAPLDVPENSLARAICRKAHAKLLDQTPPDADGAVRLTWGPLRYISGHYRSELTLSYWQTGELHDTGTATLTATTSTEARAQQPRVENELLDKYFTCRDEIQEYIRPW